ncbi:hypothetical protein RHGRI_035123 [Rhododendron griersonianum]|uniref:Disease resistance N-terminal domain-containing protein n=1 Tax=Rhododendron griersonianum TaxID=479676 RepID=A0AAV6I3C0_9ERIC|nr:hypothetical protein RHGRI_035123 [Rhododendron griersonianum]
MGDIAVDIFLETLKQLITNSKLRLIIGEKHQLQSLETEIKYLREFLKVTEKKRNEHIEVMNLVRQIREVVFESENTVALFVSCAYKQDDLSLDLESVKNEIKNLTAKVKQMYDENMYDINETTVKKLTHSFTGSSGSDSSYCITKSVDCDLLLPLCDAIVALERTPLPSEKASDYETECLDNMLFNECLSRPDSEAGLYLSVSVSASFLLALDNLTLCQSNRSFGSLHPRSSSNALVVVLGDTSLEDATLEEVAF